MGAYSPCRWSGVEVVEQMTALDQYIAELNKPLLKILRWPYKKERDETIDELIRYLSEQRTKR